MSPARSPSATAASAAAPVFAALGDETRLRLVARLCKGGPQSIAGLAAGSEVTRQAITKHLQVLGAAGLARSVREGRERVWECSRADSRPCADTSTRSRRSGTTRSVASRPSSKGDGEVGSEFVSRAAARPCDRRIPTGGVEFRTDREACARNASQPGSSVVAKGTPRCSACDSRVPCLLALAATLLCARHATADEPAASVPAAAAPSEAATPPPPHHRATPRPPRPRTTAARSSAARSAIDATARRRGRLRNEALRARGLSAHRRRQRHRLRVRGRRDALVLRRTA